VLFLTDCGLIRSLGREFLGTAFATLTGARELDLVSRNGSLVDQLHGIPVELHGLVKRDLIAVDLAVGDRHFAPEAADRAGQGVPVDLESEGRLASLSAASGHFSGPFSSDVRGHGCQGQQAAQ